jgi:hypothetical protein
MRKYLVLGLCGLFLAVMFVAAEPVRAEEPNSELTMLKQSLDSLDTVLAEMHYKVENGTNLTSSAELQFLLAEISQNLESINSTLTNINGAKTVSKKPVDIYAQGIPSSEEQIPVYNPATAITENSLPSLFDYGILRITLLIILAMALFIMLLWPLFKTDKVLSQETQTH